MAIRMISLSHELDQKLKEEENASGLITKLLLEHYELGSGTTIEELDKQEEKIRSKLELLSDKEKNKLEQIEFKRNKLVGEKVEKEISKRKEEDKLKRQVENFTEVFLEETKQNPTEEIIRLYKEAMKENKTIGNKPFDVWKFINRCYEVGLIKNE